MLGQDKRYAGSKQFPTLLVLMRIYQNSWPFDWPGMMAELDAILASHHTALAPMGFPEEWHGILTHGMAKCPPRK